MLDLVDRVLMEANRLSKSGGCQTWVNTSRYEIKYARNTVLLYKYKCWCFMYFPFFLFSAELKRLQKYSGTQLF